MLCAIYKSKKKEGMYLYVEKRDYFERVPEVLRSSFGLPIFVMLFNLSGSKSLVNADKQKVQEQIIEKGFYLQMPKEDDLLKQFPQQNISLFEK
ncbi:YcgL domain-containing protein [Haemophilus haemoglobinophilus]|nr:YcgL domain-containing protein [Canicola haemoglobinophilus]